MDDEVLIKVLGVDLVGDLTIPVNALGLVIFAHDTGNGRENPRNLLLSNLLNKNGIATLLIDLLNKEEGEYDKYKNDIELLTDRLVGITKWCMENEKVKNLQFSYFGMGNGSAAALSAAAYWGGTKIRSVVSRGGRPDLAGEVLDLVESPTLLIVGGDDRQAIDNNRQAYIHLGCEKKTEIIPGATHFFEEEGALEKVSELATKWILRHFE